MFFSFIMIVSITAIASTILLWAIASLKRRTSVLLSFLMDSHERNLRSEDPAQVAAAKCRWRLMCRRLQAEPRNAGLGLDLERWGELAATEQK